MPAGYSHSHVFTRPWSWRYKSRGVPPLDSWRQLMSRLGVIVTFERPDGREKDWICGSFLRWNTQQGGRWHLILARPGAPLCTSHLHGFCTSFPPRLCTFGSCHTCIQYTYRYIHTLQCNGCYNIECGRAAGRPHPLFPSLTPSLMLG